jgi:hypothetical protein
MTVAPLLLALLVALAGCGTTRATPFAERPPSPPTSRIGSSPS